MLKWGGRSDLKNIKPSWYLKQTFGEKALKT